jgi:hypothetical protein
MHIEKPGKHEVQDELGELKVAVRKISELSTRMSKLASRKLTENVETFSGESETQEEIEERVQRLSEALTEFLVLRKRLKARYSAFEKSLEDLERAAEVDEISTLAGFSVLASQKELRSIMDKIVESNLKAPIPQMSEIERVVRLASEARDLGKWMSDMTGYEQTTGDDDFTRMIVAIRDRNMKKFNEIHERMKERLDTEEHTQT